VLTYDTVASVTLQSFLKQYARRDDFEFYRDNLGSMAKRGEKVLTVEETDSEGEPIRNVSRQQKQAVDEGLGKCTAVRSSPWQLSALQGVFFLAEAEPKVKLQFQRTEEFLFSRDGERQRWRRHLAYVLKAREERPSQEQASKQGQGWSVVPTDKIKVDEVKKYALAKQKAQLALKNS